MSSLTFSIETGSEAFVASVDAFTSCCDGLADWDLLGSSRCHGWSRLDVITHVAAGWQELIGAFVSATTTDPTVDGASYWSSFAEENAATDPVALLLAQRRRTDSYTRPSTAIHQLRDVADYVKRGALGLADGNYSFQGHVLTAGDLLGSWAVENSIHHLDLATDTTPVPEALRLARQTCDALLRTPLPEQWSDIEAVLVATGRKPTPATHPELAGALPVIS